MCPLASGPNASRITLKVRPVYLHLVWCRSTSIQHCAPYTCRRLIAVLDVQASPSQLTQIAVAHPWGRSCRSSAAPLPGNSTTSARLTFAFIWVTSHLHRSWVILLTAVAAHSTPLRLDVYYISLYSCSKHLLNTLIPLLWGYFGTGRRVPFLSLHLGIILLVPKE